MPRAMAAGAALGQAAGQHLREGVRLTAGSEREVVSRSACASFWPLINDAKTDERDEQRDQGEHELEGEGPGVGEAVAVPHPLEGVGHQLADPGVGEGGAGVVGGQFVLIEATGLRDVGGGAHGSAPRGRQRRRQGCRQRVG